LEQLDELDVWPLLFILGANHYEPFSKLLQDNGVEVIEGYRDWEPEPGGDA